MMVLLGQQEKDVPPKKDHVLICDSMRERATDHKLEQHNLVSSKFQENATLGLTMARN